jgi:hypothetical protein
MLFVNAEVGTSLPAHAGGYNLRTRLHGRLELLLHVLYFLLPRREKPLLLYSRLEPLLLSWILVTWLPTRQEPVWSWIRRRLETLSGSPVRRL